MAAHPIRGGATLCDSTELVEVTRREGRAEGEGARGVGG